MKINIYTSCYSKMLNRHKYGTDYYMRVSKGLFLPKKGVDNKSIMSMIDLNYSDLGMFEATLPEYENRIRGEEYNDILSEIANTMSEKFLSADMKDEDLKEIEAEIKELEKAKEEVEKLSIADRLKEWEKFSDEEKEGLYAYGLSEKTLENIEDWKPELTYNFFILCFEDLEAKYTEKDEAKNPDCKAGTFKTCHRTVLAKILNERFNLNITEW